MIAVNEQKSVKIQTLRGLAIIAVVFIHVTPLGMAQVICRPFLNFAVGVFLFLSGLLSDVDKWNPFKRIIKILVPYVIWTFVYTVIWSYSVPDQIFRKFLHYLIYGNSAAVMYYVFVYCEFILLIPLIDKLAGSRFKFLGFFISPLEIAFMRLIPIVFNIQLNKFISSAVHLSCLGWFTYFYLGYLLGNNYIDIKWQTKTITILWAISLLMQMLEGYWYYSMGVVNCGTQSKLTAVLSGSLFCILAYRYIESDSNRKLPLLITMGNNSFGIFFSHLAVLQLFHLIPGYKRYLVYPFKAVLLVFLSLGIVMAGHRILGRFAKYMAF